MKRLVLVVIVLVVVAGLALPVSNLVVGLPASNSLSAIQTTDPHFDKAKAILAAKCVNCHTSEYNLPFYGKFPIAKPVIEWDIHEGIEYLDLVAAFQTQKGAPVSEVVLAKNEYVVERGTMPPMRYLALHWNGGLSASEKETVLAWVKETRRNHYAPAGLPPEVRERVIQPLPEDHGQDPAKVALGDKLYHDVRLSKDNTVSCASCHGLDKGGTDQEKFSEGVGGATGDINAPTTFNSGFQFVQFWDGRAATLEDQADGPVNNPIEMASNWPEAIPKLEQDAALTAAFKAQWPEGYSKDTVTSAIAIFERTLITPNSAFDKFLKGDQGALSPEARQGYGTFLDYACATCHAGKLMGGQSYEKMGRKADYFGDRGNVGKADYGRFNVTGEEEDRFRLKVPTLRNIALTMPYLHDGSTSDLAEVVGIMAKYMAGRDMASNDVGAVVQFLNALTGEYNGQVLQ